MLPTAKKYIFLSSFLIISIPVLLYFSDIKLFFYSLIRADTTPRSSETDRTPDGIKQIRELINKNKYTNIKDNIILITIDTARADHFRCYGNSGIDTPNIDKLADNGVLFENSISPAPITLVSHSSMFTGLYPYAHGIRENGIFYLDNKFLTLAEILKANGYTTAAFVSSYPLHSQFNLGQGFEHYDDQFTRLLSRRQAGIMRWQGHKITKFERPADKVTLNYLNWLIPNSNKKFFTWIHYFDPHKSYRPPLKYKKKYGNKPESLYKGEISFVDECIGYIFKYRIYI
jgi:arylsulfatase A-like enzyme